MSVDLPGMIVQSVGEAIVGETLDGTVVLWNRAAEQLYGYPAAEMIGQRADRLYPPGRPDGERIRRDGSRIRVCSRAAPIVDHAGVTVGVATTSWLPENDRLGHDLRTPLNAVLGFTETLLMRLPGPLNDEQEHQLRLVRTSAEQLLARINQLP
ncbi:histidine kinase dimerization/phospho-acceptor domain-containing protein [Actinoplanes sp. CA-142083]|uniref:histidine kinase dimerization/phospho-acceptor domain-containing protein n=1 Tax=Actinoplanes sp. CA-142083 TaxID=3239903 RepID=UPI003D92BFDC